MSRITLYIIEKERVKSVEDGLAAVRVHQDGQARPLQVHVRARVRARTWRGLFDTLVLRR
jgi:hypothetical protein